MKTWEVYKALTEDRTKKFIRMLDGEVYFFDDSEWLDGKNIYVITEHTPTGGQDGGYKLNCCKLTSEVITISRPLLRQGEWHIES